MNTSPSFSYFDKDGNPVASAADPEWKYTVIDGRVRTVKGAPPQKLENGHWVNLLPMPPP